MPEECKRFWEIDVRYLAMLLFCIPMMAFAQSKPEEAPNPLSSLAWQIGPTEEQIGTQATLQVPDGYAFLDEGNTRKFLELMGNPPRDGHYLIAPESLKWFAVFSFDPSGYVKDDEKIDPDQLLKALKESDEPANDERKRLGMPAIYTDGWDVTPHYDAETKRLEWGVRLRTDENEQIVNYTSRLLGRSGVMSAILVSDPESLRADAIEFKSTLNGFNFVSGEQMWSAPQKMKIGCRVLSAMRTIAFSVGGHSSGAPSGDFSQAKERMRSHISPAPARNDGFAAGAMAGELFDGVPIMYAARAPYPRKSPEAKPDLLPLTAMVNPQRR